MPESAANSRGECLWLAGKCAALLVLATALGFAANALRPVATRLPWIGDWEHHVETLAFRQGVPVAFLAAVRERMNDPAAAIFDARPPEQYAAGHLPGARNVPVAEADRRLGEFAAWLKPATPILTYCGGADCDDALELAMKLRGYGFGDVTLYPGGYAEWTEYEGAVRTGDAP